LVEDEKNREKGGPPKLSPEHKMVSRYVLCEEGERKQQEKRRDRKGSEKPLTLKRGGELVSRGGTREEGAIKSDEDIFCLKTLI